MKTAISIPDKILKQAEAVAKKYLERRQAAAVTRQLNELNRSEAASLDPDLHETQVQSLKDSPW